MNDDASTEVLDHEIYAARYELLRRRYVAQGIDAAADTMARHSESAAGCAGRWAAMAALAAR